MTPEVSSALRRVNEAVNAGKPANDADLKLAQRLASQAGWGAPAAASRALEGKMSKTDI